MFIDSSYTFPWPWADEGEAFNVLQMLNPKTQIQVVIAPEKRKEFDAQMKELGHIWQGMSMRARVNTNCDGPLLFDHEEAEVDDEVLLEWYADNRGKKRLR